MSGKVLNDKNTQIKNKAYEFYEEKGFRDGNDVADWLEAERLTGKPEVKRQAEKRFGLKKNK